MVDSTTSVDLRPKVCCPGCPRGFCDEACIEILAAQQCKRVCGPRHEPDDCADACCTADNDEHVDCNDHGSDSASGPAMSQACVSEEKDCCKNTEPIGQPRCGDDCCDDVCDDEVKGKNSECCAGKQDQCGDSAVASKLGTVEGKDACCYSSDLDDKQRPSACGKSALPDTSLPLKEGSAGSIRSCVEKTCCTAKTAAIVDSHAGSPCDSKSESSVKGNCLDDCCNEDSCESEDEPIIKDSQEAPCSAHLQSAFDRYAALLRQGLCLCRDVLDGQEDCCSLLLRKGARPAHPSATASPSTCYKGKATTSCANKSKPIESTEEKCSLDDIRLVQTSRSFMQPKPSTIGRSKASDAEMDAVRQHIVLNVSGMTCTGCATKMRKVLERVPGVSDIQVTFVSGITAFKLDDTAAVTGEVILQIEKETGFKCSQVISNTQTLDLVVDEQSIKAYLRELPTGAEHAERVDKRVLRIHYDPAIVGAKTLLAAFPDAQLAPPAGNPALTEGQKALRTSGISFVLSTLLTIPVAVLAWDDTVLSYTTTSVVSLTLATLVQCIAIPEFYVGAIKALVYSRVIEMDMLVVISITAAYGYSVVAFGLTRAGYVLKEKEFFETSTLLITLVLLGRLVAAFARLKAVSAVSTRSLQAQTAHLLDAAGDTQEIDARLLQYGDTIVIPPHSGVVTDGDVISGESAVDESMITGESVPLSKTVGDSVIAGTINGPGSLTISLTRLPGANSITDIANMVENALGAKPRVQDLADKVASWFIPTVVLISVIVFVIWIGVAKAVRGESGGNAVGTAITYGIAVLAVSCPCALGLAVPMVLVVAGGVAARAGVIIKQADVLERGHRVSDVVFDKTGTITKKDLSVVHESINLGADMSVNEIRAVAKAMIKDNDHPVSIAANFFLSQTKDTSIPNAELSQIQSIPGAGIQAVYRGDQSLKAGNPYWLKIDKQPEVLSLIEQGMTIFCVTLDFTVLMTLGLKSSLRAESSTVVSRLLERNITCHIVSGDGPKAVKDVADAVGIPEDKTASRHSPAEKQKYVQNLLAAGKTVLFCGDGTNDAVAVAQANIGVQIGGTASDVTRAAADVVLVGDRLDGVLVILEISKRAFRRIVFNFIWSAVYNVFAILLASGAFVKVRIAPAYAGLGEIVSVLPVIVAAMSLVVFKIRV